MQDKANGKTVYIEPVSARTFFDIQDAHEGNDRAINMALMAAAIVDSDSKSVFTADSVQDMPLPEFQRLQAKVSQANAYEGDEGKN